MNKLQIAKEEFALMTIFFDYIDDFIVNQNLTQETKYRANMARKAFKNLINFAYGVQNLEEFDEYKEKIINYALNVVSGQFHLLDENPKELGNEVKKLIGSSISVELTNVRRAIIVDDIIKDLNDNGFKIVKL